ncbi:MAG: hypothetical protein Q8R13_02225 [bacterium]|nr:hypothetical protein [bacterium]MDZ4296033.1 hypothetical protein [Patescibacteria group bacterium]
MQRSLHAFRRFRYQRCGAEVPGAKAEVSRSLSGRAIFFFDDVAVSAQPIASMAAVQRHRLKGAITYDRGSKSALWQMIKRDADLRVCFARPLHSWKRGKHEHTNGKLRRVFPKCFDFSTIAQWDVNRMVTLMNHTPRQSLYGLWEVLRFNLEFKSVR